MKTYIKLALLVALFLFYGCGQSDIPNNNMTPSSTSNRSKQHESSGFEKYRSVTKFDQYFKKYTKRFFGPGFDWLQIKAQAIAESNLSPGAESAVGAEGLMQIMPKTYEEILTKCKFIEGPVYEPRWAIAAGTFYDREIWSKWSPKKTVQDKINFMMASYNAGRGHIINAQKKCDGKNHDPDTWVCIEHTLPSVTGHHSKETLGYVDRIQCIVADLQYY